MADFYDHVKIYVKAGNGGNGCISFPRYQVDRFYTCFLMERETREKPNSQSSAPEERSSEEVCRGIPPNGNKITGRVKGGNGSISFPLNQSSRFSAYSFSGRRGRRPLRQHLIRRWAVMITFSGRLVLKNASIFKSFFERRPLRQHLVGIWAVMITFSRRLVLKNASILRVLCGTVPYVYFKNLYFFTLL